LLDQVLQADEDLFLILSIYTISQLSRIFIGHASAIRPDHKYLSGSLIYQSASISFPATSTRCRIAPPILTDPELRRRIRDGGLIRDYAQSYNPPRILAIITILFESPLEEIIRDSRIMRMMDSPTLK
jgi:hypothetical protein